MFQFPLIASYFGTKAWIDASWSMTVAYLQITGVLVSSKDRHPLH